MPLAPEDQAAIDELAGKLEWLLLEWADGQPKDGRLLSHLITFAALDALERFPLSYSILEQEMENRLLENARKYHL